MQQSVVVVPRKGRESRVGKLVEIRSVQGYSRYRGVIKVYRGGEPPRRDAALLNHGGGRQQ
jgi:hypothetical protein